MTEPLLWLDGDPTDGRRAHPHAPEMPQSPPSPPPVAAPPPRVRGRFASALAGGLVAATLVGAGAVALDLTDHAPATAAAPIVSKPGDVASIYASARDSVVSIKTQEGSGTGFVVGSGGKVVTNAHVVGDATRVQVQFADNETAAATVTGVDRSSDLALLKVDTNRTLKPLPLADSSTVKTGQLAVAIGSPLGLPQTATAGIVSATGRHIQAPNGFQIDSVIQTDAPINPGNSGGPLLDANGQVIGINSQIASQSGGNEGIGFAVPSNTVRDVIPRLEKGETIKRAYLGISTTASSGGVSVAAVSAGAPAEAAGVKVGDVIVSVGGKPVSTPDDVVAAIQDRKPGESVALEIRRGGSTETVQAKLAERPATATP